MILPMPSPVSQRRLEATEQLANQWIAYHEAGHAAVSISLGEGNQRGIIIGSMKGDAWAGHVRDEMISSVLLPPTLQAEGLIRRFLVASAGPLSQAKCQGSPFSWTEFYESRIGDIAGNDAEVAVKALDGLAARVNPPGDSKYIVTDLQATAEMLIGDPVVWNLVEAVADRLFVIGGLTGDGLEDMAGRHPLDPNFGLLPRKLLEHWRTREFRI
jgi:hypothetical protein